MKLHSKDVLGMKELTPGEILLILDTADSFAEVSTRDIKKVPTLRGKTIINLFYEASTRTRTSFELAAKRLSADAINISTTTSSVVKGETLIDTAKTLEAMNPDVVVIRHSASGAPHLIARMVRHSVINGGDGFHEHPTQALLDMLTIRRRKGTLKGLEVAIIGDIAHSRVAHSNIHGLTRMGCRVTVCGPAPMIPRDIDKLGVSVTCSMEEAVRNRDVVMMLRIQFERHRASFPSIREYAKFYCLNEERLALANPGALVMHPGPINRGTEIAPEIADGMQSVILEQVTNGIAVRMALLYLLSGGSP